MNRWNSAPIGIFFIANFVLAAGTLLSFDLNSQTLEAVRRFPPDTQRGTLRVTTPPEVLIDGQGARLSPGSRIFSTDNALVLSATLVGQDRIVNFRRDPMGQLLQVWILSPEEVRQGATSVRNFSFASDAPASARDDGKTPFDQLPKYPAR